MLPIGTESRLRMLYGFLCSWRIAAYHTIRFLRHSSTARRPIDRARLEGVIYKQFHAVEKGLALPEPRPGFGAASIASLMENIRLYEADHAVDETTANARASLAEYVEYNSSYGVDVSGIQRFLELEPDSVIKGKGGTDFLSWDSLFPTPEDVSAAFLLSRRTVRVFTGQAIPKQTLEEIYILASRAPSVCNRQAAGVFFVTDREQITRALSFQNGNRGFGDTIGALALVTADQTVFTSCGELYQDYVDGGIFAMSLLLAAHAKQVGGCMLNWSVTAGRDKKMRRALGIPDNETVITMIGFGVPADSFKVAHSPRLRPDSRLRWIE